MRPVEAACCSLQKLHNNALILAFTPTDLADIVWAYGELAKLKPDPDAQGEPPEAPRSPRLAAVLCWDERFGITIASKQ